METGEFTTPEGNKLRYYCTGAGNRTFVLLHAQGTSSESYFEVAKQLGKTAKVISRTAASYISRAGMEFTLRKRKSS